MDIFATAATPGKWLVDAFPPCMFTVSASVITGKSANLHQVRFLPNWFPMVKFKKQAQLWEQTISDCYDKPIAFVRRQMVRKDLCYIVQSSLTGHVSSGFRTCYTVLYVSLY